MRLAICALRSDMDASDPSLIRRTLSGDADAFGQLVDRYKEAVYGAAYARLGNFQDAQDIAQEAFIQAYRRLASLQTHGRFASWLYAIVCNLCRDHFRTRRETLPLEEGASLGASDPADEHDRRALHRRIQRAIAALSDTHRETVTLYYINGYTCDEVGRFLDVPTGTVKRRLFDARKQLKKEMTDMVRDMFDAHKLPPNFRKVVIDGGALDPKSDTPRLHIRDRKRRGFPIETGDFQATAIYMHLQKDLPPRPITYDLFHGICSAFGIVLDGIGITKYRNRYRADVTFTRGKQSITLEADPGDAVALAIRFNAPVYADESLLKGTIFRRPKKAPMKLQRQKPRKRSSIQIAENSPFALVDNSGDKIEKAQIVVSVQRPASPPSERTRARRISNPGTLLSIQMASVALEPNSRRPLIWLADKEKRTHLRIVIGNYEVGSIASALPKAILKLPGGVKGKTTRDRGWAYDLLKTVLDTFGIVHDRAVIDLLHSDTFYAFSFFRRGKTVRRLDTRPSDAIALSLRTGAEIEIHKTVLEQAGLDRHKMQELQEKNGKEKTKERRVEVPYILKRGDKFRFAIKSCRKFTWESSHPSIASVTPDGVVEAYKEGNATITATWVEKK